MAKLENDISGIKEILKYVQRDISEIKEFQKTIDQRATDLETSQAEVRTKISLFAGMQGVFSVVVGAVATYLGGQR